MNCKLAYDWLGAIKFLSNHFWFRKHSAILETSNIYFCLICSTFGFRWGKHSFVFYLWVLSKVHSGVAEENAYLATLFLFTVFCSVLCLNAIVFVKNLNSSSLPICQFQRTKVLLLVSAIYSPTNWDLGIFFLKRDSPPPCKF